MAAQSNSNQSVGKALQIIGVLVQNPSAMRLQDIAQAVEMPPSTVLRMLNSLMEYGYVSQEESSRYYLTLKFAQIGSIVGSRFSLRDMVHPHLVKLSRQCGEACCIAVREGMSAMYIDVIDGPDGMLRIMQYIGKQSPLHCTGVGKCLMQDFEEGELDALIQNQGLPPMTPKTITDKAGLLRELELARRQGYAMDNEECELGARCVAAGIKDYTGRTVAAISVSGPVSRMTGERVRAISGYVTAAAAEISQMLSYPG